MNFRAFGGCVTCNSICLFAE
jgi:hypothetical protein